MQQKGQQDICKNCMHFCFSKKDKYRTRITIGGNLVNYPGDCRTPTTKMLMVKLLLNSVISKPNVKFITLNFKDFYLMMPTKRYNYFRMKLDLFPQDIIDEYTLTSKVDCNRNGHCKVQQGMYGLPQAGIIAQELLMTQNGRLHPEQRHTRLLEAQMATHQLHTSRGQFWHLVNWERTCDASHQRSQEALQSQRRLGR
jgi:hypothetical protein